MPSQQATRTKNKNSAETGARKQPASQPVPSAKRAGQTGTTDNSYALISVLYHALQGADTLNQYIQDAEGSSDQELVRFFEETREVYVERAAEAKELLADQLTISEQGDEEEDEEEDEENEEA